MNTSKGPQRKGSPGVILLTGLVCSIQREKTSEREARARPKPTVSTCIAGISKGGRSVFIDPQPCAILYPACRAPNRQSERGAQACHYLINKVAGELIGDKKDYISDKLLSIYGNKMYVYVLNNIN
jgi:hypothetical protein